MFIHYFTLFLALLFTQAHTLSSDHPETGKHSTLFPRAPPLRDVSLLVNYDPRTWITSDGEIVFKSHTALLVSGTAQDGPLKIEIADDESLPPERGLNIRVLDLTPAQTGKQYANTATRMNLLQMQTTLTNKDFMDPRTGKGIVANAWGRDYLYRVGPLFPGKINSCNTFLQRLIEDELGGRLTDRARDFFDKAAKWSETFRQSSQTQIIDDFRLETAGSNGSPNDVRKYIFHGNCRNPPRGKSKRAGACIADVSATDEKSPTKVDPSSQKNELAAEPDASSLPKYALALDEQNDFVDRTPSTDSFSTKDGGAKVTIARVGGTLNAFTAVSKDVLATLGVAGTIVGAVFVILDFIDHNWVGGAIGGVGLAASIAVGIAVSGPLGWIVGGAIAALFAILPGLFKDMHPPAATSDIAGIIQWKLFGDKDHTGNEQCQKGTPDSPGNPDCQAAYGPGALSMAMGFDNFDAIVFLQQFNNGYPMTIKDMAAVFYVIDPTKNGDGNDKIATIDCHNSKGVPGGKAGIVGADNPKLCNHPEFLIKREMINLPHLGTTADKIFSRIIPAPNGDCKLVTYPSERYVPFYNLTMTGLGSAIACHLTAAINVDGTAVPVKGDTNSQTPQIDSSGSSATNGQGSAFVAPPPATPFKSLDPKDYVCLAHGTDSPFCLPPGTYSKQSGLGFEIKSVDTLTLPPGGWSLAIHWKDFPERYQRGDKFTDRTYKANQVPSIQSDEYKEFKGDMSAIDTNRDGVATFTILGPTDAPDPVCCLFTEPKFGGNAWCVGVGGGDVVPQWKNQAQSVSCHKPGQVWLYAKEYGDAGALFVDGNIENLKDNLYGTDKGTFSQNVKAIWVLKGK